MSRTEFLAEILDWFGILSVQEYSKEQQVKGLFRVYPNPGYGNLTLYGAPEVRGERVLITIYDAAGRVVQKLTEKRFPDKLVWNLKDINNRKVADGVYFLELRTDQKSEFKKVIILE
ncbi:MAG TPA: T9SS type A sorting domain-containing protein [candidate division WOR-3 bacterium]|uniref:T9SS type A sorting domain-containing protein n=1 Tax=candidate division WOR-3 bacterium TaxID=2052148 RepID=A0A9C9EL09_UNCW3|nr:T9SS type A sorting domain-containing protein [candidate division WOR-3 bacterium]